MPKPYKTISHEEARFTCDFPADWTLLRRDTRREQKTKTYRFSTFGPKGKEGIAPTITAAYYSPENKSYRDGQQYIDLFMSPMMNERADTKISEPKVIMVGTLKAKHFNRHTSMYYPPKHADAKKVKLLQEHVVIDFEGGFYLLDFECPKSDLDRWRPVFQHVIDTFRPIDAKKKSE